PLNAVGSRCWAYVAAGAAVVGIRIQEGACPVAVDRALDAPVCAVSIDACAVLVETRLRTRVSAGAAVVEVVGKIGAGASGTGQSITAAGVTAAARSTETAGGPAARLAGGEARILLPLVAAPAEGLARVGGTSNGDVQPQWAEDEPG